MVKTITNGGLIGMVYRKATTTIRMLHFSNNHPIGHKVSYLRAPFTEFTLMFVQKTPTGPTRYT